MRSPPGSLTLPPFNLPKKHTPFVNVLAKSQRYACPLSAALAVSSMSKQNVIGEYPTGVRFGLAEFKSYFR